VYMSSDAGLDLRDWKKYVIAVDHTSDNVQFGVEISDALIPGDEYFLRMRAISDRGAGVLTPVQAVHLPTQPLSRRQPLGYYSNLFHPRCAADDNRSTWRHAHTAMCRRECGA
jgi:hypothetical protein